MKRRIYLRFLEEPVATSSPRLQWRIVPSLEQGESTGIVAVDELAAMLATIDPSRVDLQLVLLLGGEHCVTSVVSIPSRQSRHVAQALPFLLEDILAEDIENYHVVPGVRNADGTLGVVAVGKSLIETIATLFRDRGVPLDAMVPDMLCLPVKPATWCIHADPARVMIRTGDAMGLAIERSSFNTVCRSLIREGEQMPASIELIVSNANDEMRASLSTQLTGAVTGLDIDISTQNYGGDGFDLLCDTLGRNGALFNLLPAALQATPRRRALAVRWQPTAWLLGVCASLHVGVLYAEAVQNQHRTAAIHEETVALYRKYFPADKTVIDVQRQMTAHIKKSESQTSGAAFMQLLGQSGGLFADINRGKSEPDVRFARISFDEAQADIRIDASVKGYPLLDDLKHKLEGLGMGMEVSSATQDGDRVKARLRIWSKS